MADTATSRYGSDRRKAPNAGADQETLIGKGWVQGVALVMIFGFFVMGMIRETTEEGDPVTGKKILAALGSTVDLLGWTLGGAVFGWCMTGSIV